MSVRFEVVLNGKRVCTAGIRGDGVLAVGLDRVKHPGQEPTYSLHVGALGSFGPDTGRNEHVSWPVPSSLGIGDEITIRLLEAGEFDDPTEIRPSPSALLEDPVFGRIEYNIRAWDGTVPFEHAPISTMRVHVCADEDGPSTRQRELFQDFRAIYASLWPSIADALAKCHPDSAPRDELMDRLDPTLGVSIYDDSGAIETCYRFRDDPAFRAYFVTIRNWEIVEICSAD